MIYQTEQEAAQAAAAYVVHDLCEMMEDLAAERDALRARVAELGGKIRMIADQSLMAEIPEGYGPEGREEFMAGYDAAICAARALIAQAEKGEA